MSALLLLWALPCVAAVPVVTNHVASNVTATAANLNATMSSTGGVPTDVYLYWGPTDGGSNKASWTSSGYLGFRPAGFLSSNVTGLSSNTTYYYSYYATNASGDLWAYQTSSNFTTKSMPLVTNNAATSVTGSTATVNGNVTSTGGAPSQVWLYWGTSDAGATKVSWGNSGYMGYKPTGSVSSNLTGLVSSTTYYYRYYASNAYGDCWATASSNFTTSTAPLVLPVISNIEPSGVTLSKVTVNGYLSSTGESPTTVWLYWGLSDSGTNKSGWQQVGSLGTKASGLVATNLSGLATGQVYYFRYYASNGMGDCWSTDSSRTAFGTFRNRQLLTFSGYARTETLTNFPVLVTFNTNVTNFAYSQFASTNGWDLRFYDSSETAQLDHEVESWMDPGGQSYVWVRLPRLPQGGTNVWAVWGNAFYTNRPASQTNGLVWGGDFAAVWHVGSTNSITNGTYGNLGVRGLTRNHLVESTTNRWVTPENLMASPLPIVASDLWQTNPGSWASTYGAYYNDEDDWYDQVTIEASGAIGSSRRFRSEYYSAISYGHGYAAAAGCPGVSGMGDKTVSGWVRFADTNVSTWTNFSHFFGFSQDWVNPYERSFGFLSYENLAENPSGPLLTFASFGTGNMFNVTIAAVTDTNWHSVAATYSSTGNVTLYWDGAMRTNVYIDNGFEFGSVNDGFAMGYLLPVMAGSYLWEAKDHGFDEVRVARVAQSSNWIYSAWLNAKSNQMFNGVGQVSGSPAIETLPPDHVAIHSATLVGRLDNQGSMQASNTWLFWGNSDGGVVATNWDNAVNLGGSAPGLISHALAGLQASTAYYYRHAVSNVTLFWAHESMAYTTALPSVAGPYRTRLVFTGYAGSESLTNFQVLVVLTNSTEFSYSQMISSNGYDLRFNDYSSGAELNYEIDEWDANGTSLVWVQVPVLASNGTMLWMSWGNSALAGSPAVYTTNGATWAGRYNTVLHLKDGSVGATGAYSYANAAISPGIDALGQDFVSATGRVGYVGSGGQFTPNNFYTNPGDYICFSTNSWAGTNNFTLSLWTRTASNISYFNGSGTWNRHALFAMYGYDDAGMGIRVGTNRVQVMEHGASYNPAAITYNYTQPNTNWTQYTVVYSNRVASLYANGRLLQANTNPVDAGRTNIFLMPLYIGGYADSGDPGNGVNGSFAGNMDEFRISPMRASSNWIYASWLNIVSNNAFMYLSNSGPRVANSEGATNIAATTAGLRGYLESTGGAPASVWVFYGTNNGGVTKSDWNASAFIGSSVSIGSITTVVGSLRGNTTYYYRYYVSNTLGESWAVDRASFVTLPDLSLFVGARMRIDLSGYSKVETLTNFTHLVRFDTSISSFDYSQFTSTNGWDLRFYSSNETIELKYEIEKWNTSGTSYVWVKLPTADSNAYFWAYWGATNASFTNSPPAYSTNGQAWDENYFAVWHHRVTNDVDSTSNRFTLYTVSGTPGGATNALTGGGLSLPNTSMVNCAWIDGTSYKDIGINAHFTLETWANLVTTNPTLSDILWLDNTNAWGGTNYWSYDYFTFRHWSQSFHLLRAGSTYDTGFVPTSNQWYYLSAPRGGSSDPDLGIARSAVYVNGVKRVETEPWWFAAQVQSRYLRFGAGNGLLMDETRVSTVQRSSNWTWWTYMNIASNESVVTYAFDCAPVVSNSAATNIAAITAVLNGFLASTSGLPTQVYVYWGSTDATNNKAAWTSVGNMGVRTVGGLSTNVTGLSSNSVYYYRYYASNSAGGAWAAPSVVFTNKSMPLVTNNAATSVAATSATVNGNVTFTGGVPSQVWLFRGTTDGGSTKASWATNGYLGFTATGSVSSNLTALSSNTTYYYRFYVSNAYGDCWGVPSVVLTTLGRPLVTNNVATAVATNTSTANGNMTSTGGTPSQVWLYWGTSDGGATKASWGNNGYLGFRPAGAVSSNLTGLGGNLVYYYRFYASNDYGDCWATASTNFTTLTGATAPVIDNDGGATSVGGGSASLNGNLTSSGGAPTTVSVYWGMRDGGPSTSQWEYVRNLGVNSTGLLSATVAGLNPNSTYYYRFFATNEAAGIWAAATTNFATTLAYPYRQWSRMWGSTSSDESSYGVSNGVAVDANGNVYVVGTTYGSFDGQTNYGFADLCLTKYSPDGTRAWSRIWGSTNSNGDYARAVSADQTGGVYVVGFSYSSFDGQTNGGGSDMVLTKFFTDGTKQWTRFLSGTNASSWDVSHDVLAAPDGCVYVAGELYGHIDSQTNAGQSDLCLSKYMPDGTRVWSRLLGSSGTDRGGSVAVSATGTIYWLGHAFGTVDGVTNVGSSDLLLTQYDTNGVRQWFTMWGSTNGDVGYDVAVGTDGSVYAFGGTMGSFDSQTNTGGGDFCLSKFTGTGASLWSRLWGSTNDGWNPPYDYGGGVYVDSSDNIYVGGMTRGIYDGQTNFGGYDLCLSRYTTDGAREWTRVWGGAVPYSGNYNGFDMYVGMAGDGRGNIYVGGAVEGNWDGETNHGVTDLYLTKWVLDPLTVTNQAATSVATNSATLGGHLLSLAGGSNANVKIYWGASDGGTNSGSWANSASLGAISGGTFSSNITGLSSNTTYYFRSYASNGSGHAWALSSASFRTGPRTLYVSLAGTHQTPFTNWTQAASNFASAISAASDGDTILISTGTYYVANAISLLKGVTILAPYGADTTIVDGAGSSRCFSINHPEARVVGLTIRNGYASGGGGVRIDYGGALRNCVIRDNRSPDEGGGVYCNHAGRLENCTVVYNAATNTGGGVYAYDLAGGEIRNSIIFFNEANVSSNRNIAFPLSNALLEHSTTDPLFGGGVTNSPAFISTNNLRLSSTSLLIEAGLNDAWTAGANDADLNARIINTTVDMGAFEYAGAAIGNAAGASNVTATTAFLNGTVKATGGYATVVYVYWGNTDATNNKAGWANSIYMGYRPVGNLTTNITGLSANTTYYYRYYASNSVGEGWGAPSSNFTTQAAGPALSISNATSIGVRRVTLNGNLTSTGGVPTTVYFFWDTTNRGTATTNAWPNGITIGVRPTGIFTNLLAGLSATTTYYYACFATNAAGGMFATTVTNFTTGSPYFFWNSGAGSGNWSVGNNWVQAEGPGSYPDNNIAFGSGTQTNANVDVANPTSLKKLMFESNMARFVIRGNGLLLYGGVTNYSPYLQTISNTISLALPAAFNAATGALRFAGAITNGGNLLTIDGTNGTLIENVVSGSGGITKDGLGALTLSGSNSFSGLLTVTGGTVVLGANTALGLTNQGTVVGAAGQLRIDGSNLTINEPITLASTNSGNNVGDYSGALYNTGTGNVLNGVIGIVGPSARIRSDGTLTINGAISNRENGYLEFQSEYSNNWIAINGPINIGTREIMVYGASEIRLNTPALCGNVWINWNGTLKCGSSNIVPASSVIILGNEPSTNSSFSGAFDLNGYNQLVSGVATNGTNSAIEVRSATAATLTVSNNADFSYGGKMSGALALSKLGAGQLVLNGIGTHTGATTVSRGTLLVSGSIPESQLSVNSGGTLGGNGRVGILNIAGGGLVSPGSLLTNAWTLACSNLSILGTYSNDISSSTEYDRLNVTGTVTLGGAASLTGRVHPMYTPSVGDMFFIIVNDGADAVGGTFSGYPDDSSILVNGYNFWVSYNGDSVSTNMSGGNDVVIRRIAAPVISNMVATSVGVRRATLNGNLISTGAAPTTVHLLWGVSNYGTSATGSWPNIINLGVRPTNSLSYTLSNLTANSTYYYTYVATNTAGGVFASPVTNFTTLPPTFTWDNGASNGLWSTALNWNPDESPGSYSNNCLILSGVFLWMTNDLAAPTFVRNLVFAPGTRDLRLNGNSITLYANISNLSNIASGNHGLQVISNALNLAAACTINSSSGAVWIAGTVSNNGFALTMDGQSNTTYLGVISGTGGIVKQGTGTNTLGASNTYSGDTTISTGGITLGVSEVIPHGPGNGDVTLNGSLELAGFNETINGLSGSGRITNSSGNSTLTIGADNDTSLFTGMITDGGGTINLIKVGTGVITNSGTIRYTGSTLISGGGLIFTNYLGWSVGSVTVASNAFFVAMGGQSTAAYTISGLLSPGGSGGATGRLWSANFSLPAGGVYSNDLVTSNTRDTIDVSGTVALTGSLVVVTAPAYTAVLGDTHCIIANDGADAVNGTFAALPQDAVITVGSVKFQISYVGNEGTASMSGGNDVMLRCVSIPAVIPAANNSVGATNATFNGNLTSTGGTTTRVYFYYGTSDGGSTKSSWGNGAAGAYLGFLAQGAVATNVAGLASNTVYYYRYYASNAVGGAWSVTTNLLTGSSPVITNSAASALGSTVATANGSLTATGGAATFVWLYWGTSNGGTSKASWGTNGYLGYTVAGSVLSNMTGLASNTIYFYRFYASNAFGDAWALPVSSFKTWALPRITNLAATGVSSNFVTLNANLTVTGGLPTYVRAYWGTSNGGTNPASWASSSFLGTFMEGPVSVTTNGLNLLTTYYCTFLASNAQGITWAVPSTNFTTTTVFHDITASAGANGTITPSNIVSVTNGASTNFVIQAASNAHIAYVLVGNVSTGFFSPISNSFTYTFANITRSNTIYAAFNRPPTIGLSLSTTSGVAPLSVLFDLSSSTDPEENIVGFLVDREGDGAADASGSVTNPLTLEFSVPGLYTTRVSVVDVYGAEGITSVVMDVQGEPPTAVIGATPTNGPAPLTVTFNSSNSVSNAYAIVLQEWDFDGDGAFDRISTNGTISWVYRQPGTNTAVLRITDKFGLQNVDSLRVVVSNAVTFAPTGAVSALPASGVAPLTVQFTAAVNDPDGTVVSYAWDFNDDGRNDIYTTAAVATNIYTEPNLYTARVTYVDNGGLQGQTTTTVTVSAPAVGYTIHLDNPKNNRTIWGNAYSLEALVIPPTTEGVMVRFDYKHASASNWIAIGDPIVETDGNWFKKTWNVSSSLYNGSNYQLRCVGLSGSVTGAISDVNTILASSGATEKSDDTGGRNKKDQDVDKDKTTKSKANNGKEVVIPAGTLTADTVFTIEEVDPTVITMNGSAEQKVRCDDEDLELTFSGNPTLQIPIEVTVSYLDEDSDGFVDGTDIPELSQSMHRLNEDEDLCENILEQEIDPKNNKIKFKTDHCTKFVRVGSLNLLLSAAGAVLDSYTSEYSSSRRASYITDGNSSSYWRSRANPSNETFTYSFTNALGVTISNAVLRNKGALYSTGFKVQVSMDNSTYSNVLTGTLAQNSSWHTFTLTNAIGRYVRLIITNGVSTSGWQLAEFELYGARLALVPQLDTAVTSDALVTPTLATIPVSISTTGGAPITAVYVNWGTNDGLTASGNWASNTLATNNGGNYSVAIGIQTNRLYFYRASASNSVGLGWAGKSYALMSRSVPASRWTLLSVPVQWGVTASNTLDRELGRQMAMGLESNNTAEAADLVCFQQNDMSWLYMYLSMSGWRYQGSGALATNALRPGQGYWLNRKTLSGVANQSLVGLPQTAISAIPMVSSNWTMIAWPYQSRHESASPSGWGFSAAGGYKGSSWNTADRLIGVSSNVEFTIYLGNDGRWHPAGSTNLANVSLEAGRAYRYYHRGAGFTWTPTP